MKDREVILGVLRRIERRLWVSRALQETAFGVCIILFCLIAFNLAGPALSFVVPAAGTSAWVAVIAVIALLMIYLVWRTSRRVTLAQAAGEADARARLRDELKSAYWFVFTAELSPFAELQLARAAVTAGKLDPGEIVPGRPPRSLFAALGLGALLVLITSMAPQLSQFQGAAAAAVSPAKDAQDLRALLQDAPRGAAVEKLDSALDTLQRADTSTDQKIGAVAEARDAIEQANMEGAAAREGLAKLAEAMKTNPKLERAAQALDAGSHQAAMQLLRQMQDEAAKEGTVAGDAETLPLADKNKRIEAGIEAQLEQASRNLSGMNAKVNQDTINRVLKAMEQANERIEVQNRVNVVKRRMQEALAVTSPRSALTANRFRSRANTPNLTPSPDAGNAEIRGGTMFRQGAGAREEDKDDTSREGSNTGSASGHSAAQALEGMATRRLDMQLKLETIQRRDPNDKDEKDERQGDQGWFYSASREQKSLLRFQDVRAGSSSDREEAMSRDRIPIRQKQIVKNYFLNLHESETK